MNLRIFKYPLEITDEQVLHLPMRSKFLDVQTQDGELVMWVLHDTNLPTRKVTIRIYGTGNPVDEFVDDAEFIASAQYGPWVWHVFARVG